MKHTQHIWRAVIILIVLLVVFITIQHFLVPESFGLAGHYRYDSLSELMDKPIIHGNITACKKCHDNIQEERDKGKHVSVSCEVCHAPLAFHVKDDKKVDVMPINRSYTLCAYCHQKLEGRPKSFPQVTFKEHLVAQGAEILDKIPDKICITCHSVHSPSIK